VAAIRINNGEQEAAGLACCIRLTLEGLSEQHDGLGCEF
jgi:hypothetical protein